MATQQINLLQLFQSVAGALQQNQGTLNQADTYNHDHGTNMVSTFNTIVQALQQKQGANPAQQLAYAGQMVQQQNPSGSGQTIANGLLQAAEHFTGKQLNIQTILPLIQLLLGGGKASVTGNSNDILGSLLGSQGSNVLGSLEGMLGGNAAAGGQGLDLGSLLLEGASLLGGNQGAGGGALGGLIGSLVGGSQPADSAYHTQSGQVIAGSILQSLSQILGK